MYFFTPQMYHDYKPDNKKIIVIGKSIEDLTEKECDEVLEELIIKLTFLIKVNPPYSEVAAVFSAATSTIF